MRQKILDFIKYNALTQTYIADAIGVKKQYLNDYLLGKVDSIDVEIKCRDFMERYNGN